MSSTHANLLVHVVYSTKYRRARIHTERERLYDYICGIICKENGNVIAIGGMPDHVHLLMRLGPTVRISDLIRIVKANSSKWFNDTFCSGVPFAWQRGFGAFSVSYSKAEQVAKYIQNQEVHHKKLTFQEEYRRFLMRHEIACDERYLFEQE